MRLGDDLKSEWMLLLKVGLFVCLLVLGGWLNLLAQDLGLRAVSLVIVIWSAARLYYFLFYVIEKYIDPDFRFSSVFSAVLYLVRRWRAASPRRNARDADGNC